MRISYKFRRPYLVNMIWHFELAVGICHKFMMLAYPEKYTGNHHRTVQEDLSDLIESMVEYGRSRKPRKYSAGRPKKAYTEPKAKNHPPGKLEKRGRCIQCTTGSFTRGCVGCAVHLCSGECWRLYHQDKKNWDQEWLKRKAEEEEADSDASTSSSESESEAEIETAAGATAGTTS